METVKVNPYAVPASAEPGENVFGVRALRWQRRTTVALAATLLGAIVSAVASVVDIHTILVSGPVMFVFAFVLAVLAVARPMMKLLLVAVPLVVFIIGVLLTINYFHWGPSQAAIPISIACTTFALLMQPAWLLFWKNKESIPARQELEVK